MQGSVLTHHLVNLALQLPGWALPLVVTASLSATINAYYYTAWMIAGFVFVAPVALSTVLYAVAARSADSLRGSLWLTLTLSVVWGIAACLALGIGGSTILAFFGPSYSAGARLPLIILALAVFPQIVKVHYVAVARVKRQLGAASLVLGLGGVLELGMGYVGCTRGALTGLTLGWLAAVCLEALFMSRTVVRVVLPVGRMRRERMRASLAYDAEWQVDRLDAAPQGNGGTLRPSDALAAVAGEATTGQSASAGRHGTGQPTFDD